MEQNNTNNLLRVKDVIKTEESRINYLKGLFRIAESDRNKTVDEEEFIYRTADILGASYYEMWEAENHLAQEELRKIHFETGKEKTVFIMQALYMCWIDDDYSDDERTEIIAIGDELGIDLPMIMKIESWIKQGMEWMRAGAEMIGLE